MFYNNNDKVNLGKFDAKSDIGIFIGYSNRSKAYRVYNIINHTIEESIHVVFDEVTPDKRSEDDLMPGVIEKTSDHKRPSDHPELRLEEEVKEESQDDRRKEEELPPSLRHIKDYPPEQIIGNVQSGVKTRQQLQNEVEFAAFISKIEPTCVEEALSDCDWIIAM